MGKEVMGFLLDPVITPAEVSIGFQLHQEASAKQTPQDVPMQEALVRDLWASYPSPFCEPRSVTCTSSS